MVGDTSQMQLNLSNMININYSLELIKQERNDIAEIDLCPNSCYY